MNYPLPILSAFSRRPSTIVLYHNPIIILNISVSHMTFISINITLHKYWAKWYLTRSGWQDKWSFERLCMPTEWMSTLVAVLGGLHPRSGSNMLQLLLAMLGKRYATIDTETQGRGGGGGHQGLTRKSDSKFICYEDTTGTSGSIPGNFYGPWEDVWSDLHHIFLIWEMILGPAAVTAVRGESIIATYPFVVFWIFRRIKISRIFIAIYRILP